MQGPSEQVADELATAIADGLVNQQPYIAPEPLGRRDFRLRDTACS